MSIPIPDTFFGTNTKKFSDVGYLLSQIVPNVLVIAGVIFFLLILGGGFAMIQSAGAESNPQQAAKAKAAVTYALIGFLLVVTAFFILQIINVWVGYNTLEPPVT